MPSRQQKVTAQAEHLLDVFRALRGRFALLEPLLFDAEMIRRLGAKDRSAGLQLIRAALLESCVLEIAKIEHDGDDRSPSLAGLIASLEDTKLCGALRESFAVWGLVPQAGEDPAVIELLQKINEREENERRAKFNALVASLRTDYAELENSPALKSFRTMCDKLIAHNQLSFDGNEYKPLDVTSLGLKLGDLRVVIEALERLMDKVTLVFRNASFDFRLLRAQLKRDSDAFWSPSM